MGTTRTPAKRARSTPHRISTWPTSYLGFSLHGGFRSFRRSFSGRTPTWKASIFRTPVIRLLLQHSMIQLRNFQQGDWGAKSNKPTSLLTARLQGLAISMLRWRQSTPMSARTTSIGKDASGSFRTASLKEYPPMFAMD